MKKNQTFHKKKNPNLRIFVKSKIKFESAEVLSLFFITGMLSDGLLIQRILWNREVETLSDITRLLGTNKFVFDVCFQI